MGPLLLRRVRIVSLGFVVAGVLAAPPVADARQCAAASAGRVPAVGEMAPDFTLPGSDGRTYRLSDYRGKQAVVVSWFAKAFTDGWTAICKSLRESGDRIREFDVAYFAASVDSVETNRKFAAQLGADYPVLSDPDKTVARAYGLVSGNAPFALRWTFYIGKDGRILHIDKQVNPTLHGRDIARRLAELGVPRRGRR